MLINHKHLYKENKNQPIESRKMMCCSFSSYYVYTNNESPLVNVPDREHSWSAPDQKFPY